MKGLIGIITSKVKSLANKFKYNNSEDYINYLESEKMNISKQSFDNVKKYNIAIFTLRNKIAELEKSKYNVDENILNDLKSRLKEMETHYEEYLKKQHERSHNYDAKIEQLKSRSTLINVIKDTTVNIPANDDSLINEMDKLEVQLDAELKTLRDWT